MDTRVALILSLSYFSSLPYSPDRRRTRSTTKFAVRNFLGALDSRDRVGRFARLWIQGSEFDVAKQKR